jgi:hypothetical protein
MVSDLIEAVILPLNPSDLDGLFLESSKAI